VSSPDKRTVFNGEIQDKLRMMIPDDSRAQLESLNQSVESTMGFLFPDKKMKTSSATTLISLEGCSKQSWHTDFDDTIEASQECLSCIIGLEDNTKLYGLIPIISSLSSSSSSSSSLSCSLQQQQQPQWKQITIHFHKGDMVLFRGDFIHAGADYQCDNIRVHYYCEPKQGGKKTIVRKEDTTYLRRDILEQLLT
jgi:ectoine hydroxylase-related dioxygenase (phytanoyl-CoA dioxygenase family)